MIKGWCVGGRRLFTENRNNNLHEKLNPENKHSKKISKLSLVIVDDLKAKFLQLVNHEMEKFPRKKKM